MSQSKTTNRINFWILFILSLIVAITLGTINSGGWGHVAKFTGIQLASYFGEMAGTWAVIIGLPLLIVFVFAFIFHKIKSKSGKIKIAYIPVWILFSLFSIAAVSNTLNKINSYVGKEKRVYFVKGCVDRLEKRITISQGAARKS